MKIIIFSMLVACVVGGMLDNEVTWTEWSDCTVACGYGFSSREKYCPDVDGPWLCGRSRAECNRFACDDPLLTSTWSQCSSSCYGQTVATNSSGAVIASMGCNDMCKKSFPNCNKKIVFAAEGGSGVSMMQFFLQKQFIKEIISTMSPSMDIAVIGYSLTSDVYQKLGSGNDRVATNAAVDSMKYTGSHTWTISGLQDVLAEVEQLTDAVVVFLSQKGTFKRGNYDRDAVALSAQIKQHAKIIGIKMNSGDNHELNAISDVMYSVDSADTLVNIYDDIANEICGTGIVID